MALEQSPLEERPSRGRDSLQEILSNKAPSLQSHRAPRRPLFERPAYEAPFAFGLTKGKTGRAQRARSKRGHRGGRGKAIKERKATERAKVEKPHLVQGR
jgi:hypothetical protein